MCAVDYFKGFLGVDVVFAGCCGAGREMQIMWNRRRILVFFFVEIGLFKLKMLASLLFGEN